MRKRTEWTAPVNPYQYVLHCLGGKWKMTLLHEISTFGAIRFNATRRQLPISEKVLSQQLRELMRDGLVKRSAYDEVPQRVEYSLTDSGKCILPALDTLYLWSIREMADKGIPIDTDNFAVHRDARYVEALRDILDEEAFQLDENYRRNAGRGGGAEPE